MLVKIADGLDVPLAELFSELGELPPSKLALSYNRPEAADEEPGASGARGRRGH